jgi:hypothetical protein
VPLNDIADARLLTERPVALGVHPAKNGWLVNGSRHDIVAVNFTHPITPEGAAGSANWQSADRPAGSSRAVYISVTDPDAFIAAVTSERERASTPSLSNETNVLMAAPTNRRMPITGWVAAAAVCGTTALLMASIGHGYLLAIHHQLPPNETFGFRDATTRSSLDAWYAAQKAGFSWLLFGGAPVLVFNMALCMSAVFRRRSPWDVFVLFMGTLVVLLVVVVIAGIHADSVARMITT